MPAAIDVEVALGRLEQLEQERSRIDARLDAIESEDSALEDRAEELDRHRTTLAQKLLALDGERVDLEGEADRLEDERRSLVDARDRADEEYTELLAELDRFADSDPKLHPALEPRQAANGVPEPVTAANTEIGDLFADQAFTVPVLLTTTSQPDRNAELDYAPLPLLPASTNARTRSGTLAPRELTPQAAASVRRRPWRAVAVVAAALLGVVWLATSLVGDEGDDARATAPPAAAVAPAAVSPGPASAHTEPRPAKPRKAKKQRRGKRRSGNKRSGNKRSDTKQRGEKQ